MDLPTVWAFILAFAIFTYVVLDGFGLGIGLMLRRYERLPFILALALFALSLAGLGISIFPDIVPGRLTIHDAAVPESSLIFMLVGAGVLIPIILANLFLLDFQGQGRSVGPSASLVVSHRN
jgi:cytochrome bd ubiquinol oxidase subunit II